MHRSKIQAISRCGIGAALMALCAWITVPAAVPFTLQTLAAALIPALLGGKAGILAIAVYLGLGAVGLPVFSGFQGGIGVLLGPTGGYLLGFLFGGAVFAVLEKCRFPLFVSMMLSLIGCYLIGTAWYFLLYGGGQSMGNIFLVCVVPFLLPDLLKLWVAWYLTRRLKPLLK